VNTHDLLSAQSRANRLYISPGFRKAYVKGARAGMQGLPVTATPYRGKGWSAWGSAWRAGWHSVQGLTPSD
jgi:hypothetical protein